METQNSAHQQIRNWKTVKQLAEDNPAFSEASLRYHLFHRETNGLSKYVRQIGRKLILDEHGFLDYDVSRSSVGRYTKNLNEIIERHNEIYQVAQAMSANTDYLSQGKMHRGNSILLQGALFKILMANAGDEVKLDSKEVMQLATALERNSKGLIRSHQ